LSNLRVYLKRLDASLKPQTLSYAAHDLLGTALYETFGLSKCEYVVQRTPMGKPIITAVSRGLTIPCFNIAHTPGLAAVAVGYAPIGIDAEGQRHISKQIRDRWLFGCAEDEAVHEWTKRESYGKLTGEGFVFSEPQVPHVFESFGIDGFTVTVCVHEHDRAVLPCEIIIKE